MRILVVEDDQLTAEALVTILNRHNYAVEVAFDGEAGWDLVEAYPYDLLLLDVMLPKRDGISLCRMVRSHNYQMPILLLTGRNSGHDKAIGLDAGADDYVVKPFDPEELVARIRALFRRSSTTPTVMLNWGKLQLDPTNCQATYDDQPLPLTAKEVALLELFLRHQQRVFNCSAILEHLWAYGEMPGEEAVRTHIKGLRQKLKAKGCPSDVIETVYGLGYRLRSTEALPKASKKATSKKLSEQKLPEQQPSEQKPSETSKSLLADISEPTRQQTLMLLERAWNRHQHRVMQQIETLQQAATTAAKSRSLSPELHQQARQEAHTLAGSLGMFGFPTGSQISREIEQLLQATGTLNQTDIERFSHLTALLQQAVCQSPHNSTIPAHSPPADQPTGQPTPAPNRDFTKPKPRLLVIDSDPTVATVFLPTATGLQIDVAPSLEEAKAKIQHHPPDVVLLDPAISAKPGDSFSLINTLSQYTPPIPVIICTAQADLQERLEVARLGGRVLLQKPIPATEILQVITQVLQSDQLQGTVLVVDDDPGILEVAATFLKPWGLNVITLDDPQQFWDVLETTVPDLLILDIEMPHINGIELCQIVRNDSRWSTLPVLFLSAHVDASSRHQVFTVGADDFISKPIVGSELVIRTINRLERIQHLRQHYINRTTYTNEQQRV